jgi:hypothetical protein
MYGVYVKNQGRNFDFAKFGTNRVLEFKPSKTNAGPNKFYQRLSIGVKVIFITPQFSSYNNILIC